MISRVETSLHPYTRSRENPSGVTLACMEQCPFGNFYRNSKEAMFITSREGVIIDINEAMEVLFAYPKEELVGTKVGRLYRTGADRFSYIEAIENQGYVHAYPLDLVKKDGSSVSCLVDAILWEVEGEKTGYYGIIRTKKDLIEIFKPYLDTLAQERAELRREQQSLVSDTLLLLRYGSDALLEHVRVTGEDPLRTERAEVSILFFDIVGSTSIAEGLAPEAFAGFLNELFVDIMDLIYGNSGSVNKLLGDGILATFGVPLRTEHDARNAVTTALRIQDYLCTYNDVRPECLVQPVKAGIGIATGWVFAGVIGSVRREEYNVLGDAVNVASRLEKLTRQTEENILIDEATYRLVKGAVPIQKKYRARLRGRDQLSTIYSLSG